MEKLKVLKIQPRFLKLIKEKSKKYEVRMNKGTAQKILANERILFEEVDEDGVKIPGSQKTPARVLRTYICLDFDDLLETFPKFEEYLPGIESAEKAKELLRSLGNFAALEKAKVGVKVLEITLDA